MQPLDAVYLQILKNLCTDLSEPVPLDGVDPSALYRLAEKHCSLPFLLPYFEQQPQFSALKQQTKQMLLSYSPVTSSSCARASSSSSTTRRR